MSRNRVAAIAAAFAAFLLPATGTATAETPRAAPASGAASTGSLVLSISDGENAQPEAGRALLLCDPSGGTHPRAAAACAQLAAAGGDVSAVNRSTGQPCVLLYAPVTVTARGVWQGTPVNYQETFGNSCVLNVTKGAIFQF